MSVPIIFFPRYAFFSLQRLLQTLALIACFGLASGAWATPNVPRGSGLPLPGPTDYGPRAAVAKSGGVPVTASGQGYIDSLLMGGKWASTTLTYSFPQDASALSGVDPAHFNALTLTKQAAVNAAMQRWAAVSGLTFSQTADVASSQLRIYEYIDGSNLTARVTDFPGSAASIDLQIGSYLSGVHWDPGGYGYFTLLHELGHTFGLKHPHDAVAGFPVLPASDDSVLVSVMSYASYPGGGYGGYTIADGSYPSSPMLNDIAAIRYLYGPSSNPLIGNLGDTTYTYDPSASVILGARWDGGGNDTLNFSNYTTNLSIDLRPGRWISLGSQFAVLDDAQPIYADVNLAMPYLHGGSSASLIENARAGSGNDTLIGNQADNRLEGGIGNDVLDGGDGDDTLVGGPGDDTLTGGNGADTFVFAASANGIDTITDFGAGDALQVSGVGVTAFLGDGDGTALVQGQVQIERLGGTTRVRIGTDATAGSDVEIILQGSFTAQDFSVSSGRLVHRNAAGQVTLPAGGGTVAISVGAPSAGPTQPALWVVQSATASTVASQSVQPPAGMSYPYGVLQFTLTNGTPGSSATVAFTFPSALPAGAQYLKLDPTTQTWQAYAGASFAGNVLTLTLTDGGAGDDDGSANGVIVDPGVIALAAPAAPGAGNVAAIPVLSPWGLAGLSMLVAGCAAWLRRRHGPA